MNVKPKQNQNVLPIALILLLLCACESGPNEVAHVNAADVGESVVIPSTVSEEERDPIAHLRIPQKIFKINCDKDTSFSFDAGGSVLHIPKDAFAFSDGSPVKGQVEISISNFRNRAEIALSNLPMKFDQNGEEVFFESAGMFSIDGKCEGKSCEVKSGKSLRIDYALTSQINDLAFYRLNDDKKGWTELSTIDKQPPIKKAALAPEKPVAAAETFEKAKTTLTKNALSIIDFSPVIVANVPYWKDEKQNLQPLSKSINKDVKFPEGMIEYLNGHLNHYLSIKYDVDTASKKLVNIRPHELNPIKDYDEFLVKLLKAMPQCDDIEVGYGFELLSGDNSLEIHFISPNKIKIEQPKIQASQFEALPADNNIVRFAAVPTDPGHTYPELITGLSVNKFGVYNCDRMYSVPDQEFITAEYFDENMAPISDPWVLSVININLKAAYSFDPRSFSIKRNGKTALVMFANSGKVYLLNSEKFRDQKKSVDGTTNLQMQEITSQVKTSQDLEKLLK